MTGHTVGTVVSKTTQTSTLWTVCGQVRQVNMGICLKNSFRQFISEENIAKRTQDGTWGTPTFTGKKEEIEPSTYTAWLLPER